MVKFSVSERFACRVLGQHRSTQRKTPKGRADEEALTSDIIRLASRYGRYGYRRITAMLRSEGWTVNAKRVERIWRREGLKVPQKQPKRCRLWLNDGSCIRLRPQHPNHVWSYDFVEGRTHNGRKFRMLNIIDEFTRECLAIRIDRKLNSTDVIDALSDLFILRGVPGHVRSDNGPEFIAKAVREWIAAVGAKTAFIEPGSPWENGYCESFNSKLRANSSTARSSTASPRQRSSSKHGGATTTPSGLTHRSDTNHRRQRPLSGLQSQPGRFRQQHKQWPKSPSCIKTETRPPHRGRPRR